MYRQTPPENVSHLVLRRQEDRLAVLTWEDPPHPDLDRIVITDSMGEVSDEVKAGAEYVELSLPLNMINYQLVFTSVDLFGNESEGRIIGIYLNPGTIAVQESYDEFGELEWSMEYDHDANGWPIARTKYWPDGSMDFVRQVEYNGLGQPIALEQRDPEGVVEQFVTRVYGTYGQVTSHTTDDPNVPYYQVYYWDRRGNQVLVEERDIDGLLESTNVREKDDCGRTWKSDFYDGKLEHTGYILYEYDDGFCIGQTEYSAAGIVVKLSEFDIRGGTAAIYYYDEVGDETSRELYEYDDVGLWVGWQRFEDAIFLTNERLFSYDETGRRTRIEHYDEFGVLTGHNEFTHVE